METEMKNVTRHIGHKIERIRRIKGINQETLAGTLGITRQTLSKIEQSESIEEERLNQIAQALGVTADTIKLFDEDSVVINNNIYDQNNTVINYNFNPIEKIVELYEELLRLEREKSALLEKLAKAENRK